MEKLTTKREPRTHRVNIALTKSERELFRNASIERGTSISNLLRQSAIKSIKLDQQIFQQS